MEDLAAFTNDLHGYLMSGGSVKPRFISGGPSTKGAPQARTAPAQPGSEPVRTPTAAK
jgi:biopolymer transport protein ExbB